VDKFEPVSGGGEMDHAEEAVGQLVIAGLQWHARLRGEGITPVLKNADGTAVLVDGQEKLWELGYCIERPEAGLSAGEKANLKYLIAIRNASSNRRGS